LINALTGRSILLEKPTVAQLVRELFPVMSHENADIGTHVEIGKSSEAVV